MLFPLLQFRMMLLKNECFSYILPLIFLAAFMCAVLFFDKTCLEMAAGHELLSKLFTRCHE